MTSRSLAVMGKTQGGERWRVSYQLKSELHGEWTVDKFSQGRCSLGRYMWCMDSVVYGQACVWTVLGDSI